MSKHTPGMYTANVYSSYEAEQVKRMLVNNGISYSITRGADGQLHEFVVRSEHADSLEKAINGAVPLPDAQRNWREAV